MIACAVLIKKISAILEISSNYLGFLMILFILSVSFPKLRFGVERFTGIAYSREAWNGFEAPLKKKFYDVDKVYHLVFRVYPFGKELDFYFKLIRLDLSRRKAFTVKGVKTRLVNS